MLARLLTVFLAASGARTQAVQEHAVLYADEIKTYLVAEAVSPPPQHGILFIGSSIFRQWTTLGEDMKPLPVFNRAFGGARTWEVLSYTDKVVLPYHPRLVVYYCGSNDINDGESADAIFSRFQQFVRKVNEALPSTRILFVSVIRAPQKRNRWDVVDQTNKLVHSLCKQNKQVSFIDVNPALQDKNGNPRNELYQADHLHYLPAGYNVMNTVIGPEVRRIWRAILTEENTAPNTSDPALATYR